MFDPKKLEEIAKQVSDAIESYKKLNQEFCRGE